MGKKKEWSWGEWPVGGDVAPAMEDRIGFVEEARSETGTGDGEEYVYTSSRVRR